MAAAILLAFFSQQASGCAACHAPEAAAEAGTAHGASCVGCHGGDPKEKDKERAHGPSLRGRLKRDAVPAACGSCHSDARKMNPIGLATDQLAQYLTSRHGESLAKGNLQVAVCTDCHGVHGIRRARDPLSPVHPSHVPATCGRCHSDAALMGKFEHPADAETNYRAAVHGQLLAKGDLGAPQCATCHGNHGAAPPGYADVGRVCGKCHEKQRELFETSAHAFYAKDGSFKACAACHSNHKIVASPKEIVGRCAPCHEPPDKEMKKFGALMETLARARTEFATTGERLAKATRMGIHTEDEELLYERAKTSLLQLAPLQHTLNEERVTALARSTTAQLAEIDGNLGRKERSERWKLLALLPIWVFLGILALLFRARGRRLEAGQEKPHDG